MQLAVCAEVSPKQERRPKKEQEPPHIKEEQEEILQRAEPALAVKSKVHCPEVEVELESDPEDSDESEETSGGQSVLNTGTLYSFNAAHHLSEIRGHWNTHFRKYKRRSKTFKPWITPTPIFDSPWVQFPNRNSKQRL